MPNWEKSYEQARKHMLQAFAETYSLSLQQTLYQMGSRIINNRSEIDEIRFSLPNNHHFLVDLEPFGLKNDNEGLLRGRPPVRPHRGHGAPGRRRAEDPGRHDQPLTRC